MKKRLKNNVTKLTVKPKSPASGQGLTSLAADDILNSVKMPNAVPEISLGIKKKFAQYDSACREEKFEDYAVATFHAETNNFEEAISDRISELSNEHALELKHNAHLKSVSHSLEAIDVIHVTKDDDETDEELLNGFSRRARRALRKIKAHHLVKLTLLGGATILLSTVGATSILVYLTENSDVYALNPLLTIPLMAVPISAGVGLELILENIKTPWIKRKAEGLVSATCLFSLILWIVGLLDMANTGGMSLTDTSVGLPKGLRVAAQILFEITGITIISSAIFRILKEYWPDDYGPAARKRAEDKAIQEHTLNTLEPLRHKLDKAKLWAKTYAGARKEYVARQCADFAVVCSHHDEWRGTSN